MSGQQDEHGQGTQTDGQLAGIIEAHISDEKTDAASDATAAPDPPEAPKQSLCGVCDKDEGRYKCPRCPIKYCSVACNRVHKDTHPPPSEQTAPAKPQAPAERGPNKDDPYSILLEHSVDIKRLFQKYPDLESELIRIQRTTLPPADGDASRGGLPSKQQNPGSCHQRKQTVWSRDVGLHKGAQALRKARTSAGDLGDGVREYCELVLHLLSSQAGEDAISLAREAAEAENTRAIERLKLEEMDEE